MFKWFIAILIAVSIFSSPIKQDTQTSISGYDDRASITLDFAKNTAKNVLMATNNIIEVLIRNIDCSTTPTFSPEREKVRLQNF